MADAPKAECRTAGTIRAGRWSTARAAMVGSSGMTCYAWDGIRVLKTDDGAGSLLQRQVHGYAPIYSVGDVARMA